MKGNSALWKTRERPLGLLPLNPKVQTYLLCTEEIPVTSNVRVLSPSRREKQHHLFQPSRGFVKASFPQFTEFLGTCHSISFNLLAVGPWNKKTKVVHPSFTNIYCPKEAQRNRVRVMSFAWIFFLSYVFFYFYRRLHILPWVLLYLLNRREKGTFKKKSLAKYLYHLSLEWFCLSANHTL